MKILSAEQIRAADQYTIKHLPIASTDLMEKASRAFVTQFTLLYPNHCSITVFSGSGNNGGDGLVISRLLQERGYPVTTYLIRKPGSSLSPDAEINYQRLTDKSTAVQELWEADLPNINTDVVIDAIFGSGLNRPAGGYYATCISHINGSESEVVSVDIPSGLFAEQSVNPEDVVVRAAHTITFQLPKLSFLFAEHEPYVGKWWVVDIGLSRDFINQTATPYHYITCDHTDLGIPKRPKHAHKGTFGRSMLVAGSYGKMGAAVLASRACLRGGVGLLTVFIPGCGYPILQTAVPEAMTLTDPEEYYLTNFPQAMLEGIDSLGIGPGLGTHALTLQGFDELLTTLNNSTVPSVMDADALNLLSSSASLLKKIPPNALLTPHPGEFARLAGKTNNSEEQLSLLQHFSQEHQCHVLLKGAYSALADPDGNVYFNCTGNPGMSTAGSGDVLTGLLTALVAQFGNIKKAGIIGMHLHGLAGDRAAEHLSPPSLIATDIIDHLPVAFQSIYGR